MTFLRVFSSCTAVVALVAACSSGGGGGANDAASFASEYCSIFAPCCGKKNRPTDGVTCRNLIDQSARGRTFDPVKGRACLSEARANAQRANFCDDAGEAPSCAQTFAPAGGGVAPGGACEDDADCATSSEGEVDCISSYSSGGAVTRVCQVRVRGKEGDGPCAGTRAGGSTTSSITTGSDSGGAPPPKAFLCYTADKLWCGRDEKCVRIQDVGGPCTGSGSYECVETAYCDSQTKTCIPRIAAGGDCSKAFSSTACVDEHYCDQTTKVCTAFVAGGAPCSRSEQCESRQCVNGKCEDGNGLEDLAYLLLCGPEKS